MGPEAPGSLGGYNRDWRPEKRIGHMQSAQGPGNGAKKTLGIGRGHRFYTVAEPRSGADGGIDLRLKKDGERFLVQCKHWRAQRVPVEVVRELYGVPLCPQCGADMVRRVARRGANAGGAFWGCSKFPACRGMRSQD